MAGSRDAHVRHGVSKGVGGIEAEGGQGCVLELTEREQGRGSGQNVEQDAVDGFVAGIVTRADLRAVGGS